MKQTINRSPNQQSENLEHPLKYFSQHIGHFIGYEPPKINAKSKSS